MRITILSFVITSLFFVFSFVNTTFASNYMKNRYDKIKWIGDAPLKNPFINMYGHISGLNKNLKSKLDNASFGRVLNFVDYALKGHDFKSNPNPVISSMQLGNQVFINKKLTSFDENILKNALIKNSAHEILQFRIVTDKKEHLIMSYHGHLTGVNFPIKKSYLSLVRNIKLLKEKGEKIKMVKIVHNHPIQAIEFFNHKKESLGFYYSPFGHEDFKVGNSFQSLLGNIPVELGIIVGLNIKEAFKVSYYPSLKQG